MSILGGTANGFNIHIINAVLKRVSRAMDPPPSEAALSVLASVLWIGLVCGVGVTIILGNRFGRKPIMSLGELIIGLFAPLQMVAESAYVLSAIRLVVGIGVGICATTKPLYIAELAGAKLRGTFVAVFALSYSAGFNVAYASNIDTSATWRTLVGTGGVPAMMLVVLIFFLPESPVWLEQVAERERATADAVAAGAAADEGAAPSMMAAEDEDGGGGGPVTGPVTMDTRMLEEGEDGGNGGDETTNTGGSRRSSTSTTTGELARADGPNECCKTAASLCTEPLTRRAFLVCLVLVGSYQCCGGPIYTTMLTTIFDVTPRDGTVVLPAAAANNATASAPKLEVKNAVQQTAISLSHLTGSATGLAVVDRIDRRPHMLAGQAITTAMLVAGSILRAAVPDPEKHYWFYAVCAYVFFWCAGVVAPFWAIVSEIFPPKTRNVGIAVTLIIFNLLATLTTGTLRPLIFAGLPFSVLLAFYATVGLTMLVLTARFLPETNGVEISEMIQVLKKATGRLV
eukprot:g3498.t1